MWKTVQFLTCYFLFQKISCFIGLSGPQTSNFQKNITCGKIEQLSTVNFVNFKMNHGIPAIKFFWSCLCICIDIEFENQQNVTILFMIFNAKSSFLKISTIRETIIDFFDTKIHFLR
jgi:hypothetical protein